MNPFDFVYPLNAPYAHSQWIEQHTPAGPTTETAYVLRLEKANYRRRYVGQYVSADACGGLSAGRALHQATRYFSASSAAAAIDERNRLNAGTEESYAIIPVKVTTTPATTKPVEKSTTVPAKTVFVARNQDGLYANYFSAADGSAGYTLNVKDARHWETIEEAAAWIVARFRNDYDDMSAPFAIERHVIPSTTTTKIVQETVPAKTTVELL